MNYANIYCHFQPNMLNNIFNKKDLIFIRHINFFFMAINKQKLLHRSNEATFIHTFK